MNILIELWRYKDSWLSLDQLQRADFLEKIGSTMGELEKAGVKCLGWGDLDPVTDQAVPYDFVALWQGTDQAALDFMLAKIKESGWYDYFDHVNARSSLSEPGPILQKHISA